MSIMKTIRFSEDDIVKLNEVQTKFELPSVAAAIRFALDKALQKDIPAKKLSSVVYEDPENLYATYKKIGAGNNETEGYDYIIIRNQVKPWNQVMLKHGDKGYDAFK